jgi:hypothetical protein
MTTTTFKSVYSAENLLFAVTVQAQLEEAGFPTRLTTAASGGYLEIEVPAEMFEAAVNMLFVEPRTGEIYRGHAH